MYIRVYTVGCAIKFFDMTVFQTSCCQIKAWVIPFSLYCFSSTICLNNECLAMIDTGHKGLTRENMRENYFRAVTGL